MDAHRLRSVIDMVIDEHERLEIDHKLARILQTLDDCAGNPSSTADETFRTVLTTILGALRTSRTNDFVESDRRILVEIGGHGFAGDGLAQRVLDIANERPFLAARARTQFAELAAELQRRIEALTAARTGLQELNVGPTGAEGESFELAILLPDVLVNGDLQRLLNELRDWDQVLKEFFPAITARPVPVSLRAFSARRFELSAPLDRAGTLAVGEVVMGLHEMFRKVRANRERATDLERQGYPPDIVSRFTAWEQQIITQGMKAIRENLGKRFVKRDASRRGRDIDRILDRGLRFLAVRLSEGVELEITGPPIAEGVPDRGRQAASHHVRAALSAARQAKPAEEPDDNAEPKREAPRMPLSKVAQPPEDDKRAA